MSEQTFSPGAVAPEVDGVGEAMAERLRTGVEMLRAQLNMDTRK